MKYPLLGSFAIRYYEALVIMSCDLERLALFLRWRQRTAMFLLFVLRALRIQFAQRRKIGERPEAERELFDP